MISYESFVVQKILRMHIISYLVPYDNYLLYISNINVYYDMILVFIFDIYTFAVFFKHSPTKNSYNIYEVIYYTKRSYFVFYYKYIIIYIVHHHCNFFFYFKITSCNNILKIHYHSTYLFIITIKSLGTFS